jgi:hypothetical protein
MTSAVLDIAPHELAAPQAFEADRYLQHVVRVLNDRHDLHVFLDTDMDAMCREYLRVTGTGHLQTPFSPKHAPGLDGRSAWVRFEHQGQIVAMVASRLLDGVLDGDRFADVVRRGGFYGRGLHLANEDGWLPAVGPVFEGPDSAYYSGAGWVSKDFRGRSLGGYLARVAIALFMREFPAMSHITGLVAKKLHDVGYPYRVNGWLYAQGDLVLDGYFPQYGASLPLYLAHEAIGNLRGRFATELSLLSMNIEPAWMAERE